MEAFVGFGKTLIGVVAIRRILNAKPNASVIIVAPSDTIVKQWKKELARCTTAFEDVKVITVNKAAKVYKNLKCNLLVIDEIHSVPTPKNKYALYIPSNFVLGLTATYERLDKGHELVDRIAPVVERITLTEGVNNGWTSRHNVYCILCDVDNLDEYNEQTNIFKSAFRFFEYDFNTPMRVLTNKEFREEYIKTMIDDEAEQRNIRRYDRAAMQALRKECYASVMGAAKTFMESMTKRKNFIYHHPKKLEIAEKIIKAYSGKKGMTFWSTIEDAEKVSVGKVYASLGAKKEGVDEAEKRTKAKNDAILKEFIESEGGGLINTVRALNMGFNVPEIEYGIIAGFNSSKTDSKQRVGRLIRINDLTKNKQAVVFYIVLRSTNDEVWFANCIGKTDYLSIFENDLDDFLAGKDIEFAPNRKVKGARY